MILATLLTLLAATPAETAATANQVATPTTSVTVTEPNPRKMSQSEIRAHNAELARNHPFYIRCVKSEETGSLIKRKLSCRTNQQWTAAETAANDEARAIADEMSSKASRTSG
jgi:hypothetical protein